MDSKRKGCGLVVIEELDHLVFDGQGNFVARQNRERVFLAVNLLDIPAVCGLAFVNAQIDNRLARRGLGLHEAGVSEYVNRKSAAVFIERFSIDALVDRLRGGQSQCVKAIGQRRVKERVMRVVFRPKPFRSVCPFRIARKNRVGIEGRSGLGERIGAGAIEGGDRVVKIGPGSGRSVNAVGFSGAVGRYRCVAESRSAAAGQEKGASAMGRIVVNLAVDQRQGCPVLIEGAPIGIGTVRRKEGVAQDECPARGNGAAVFRGGVAGQSACRDRCCSFGSDRAAAGSAVLRKGRVRNACSARGVKSPARPGGGVGSEGGFSNHRIRRGINRPALFPGAVGTERSAVNGQCPGGRNSAAPIRGGIVLKRGIGDGKGTGRVNRSAIAAGSVVEKLTRINRERIGFGIDRSPFLAGIAVSEDEPGQSHTSGAAFDRHNAAVQIDAVNHQRGIAVVVQKVGRIDFNSGSDGNRSQIGVEQNFAPRKRRKERDRSEPERLGVSDCLAQRDGVILVIDHIAGRGHR